LPEDYATLGNNFGCRVSGIRQRTAEQTSGRNIACFRYLHPDFHPESISIAFIAYLWLWTPELDGVVLSGILLAMMLRAAALTGAHMLSLAARQAQTGSALARGWYTGTYYCRKMRNC
jgi:hypothetical protein